MKSSSLLASMNRQLLWLGGPRVLLGHKGPFVKQEVSTHDSQSLVVPLKVEWDTTSACSLCTHAPGDSQLFQVFFLSDASRQRYLRTLLAIEDDTGELIFCSLCRLSVTRLFNLREEVEDLEIRIRTVVKLRNQQQRSSKTEEKLQNDSFQKDPDFEVQSNSSFHNDETSSSSSDDESESASPSSDNDSEEEEFIPNRHLERRRKYKGTTLGKREKELQQKTFNRVKDGEVVLFGCPQCGNKFRHTQSGVIHIAGVHSRHVVKRKVLYRSTKTLFSIHDRRPFHPNRVTLTKCYFCSKTYVPGQKPEWKYKQYTPNDMMAAIEAVKTRMTVLQAARKYRVPSRTLYDKVKKLGFSTNRPYPEGNFPMSPNSDGGHGGGVLLKTADKTDDVSGYSPDDLLENINLRMEVISEPGSGMGKGGGGGVPLSCDEHKVNNDP